ncbi:MAG: helix-turn-helix domain-containing protein [Desulfobacterales bacterium]|nr:helix-turn-helix domain-containing protein [Desulfobacterales bacterium]
MTVKEICNRYQISRPSFYKWFNRYRSDGHAGLSNKLRTSGRQPNQLSTKLEKVVLEYSAQNPAHGPVNIALNLPPSPK